MQNSIEALGDSLSSWGGKDGAIIVVSHDRAFCNSVGFTHVATLKDGDLIVEERGLEERDWEQYNISSTVLLDMPAKLEFENPKDKAEKERKRKLAFNAPKRILKIEVSLLKCCILLCEQVLSDISPCW